MDEMFQLLWRRYRTWSETSARLKKRNTAWQRRVLVLTIGGTTLTMLAPFAGDRVGRFMPVFGATALALATYFGKELLDAKHGEQWARARSAAEAFKSEAHRYLVQAPPYDGIDRVSRLKARMADVSQATKDQIPDDIGAAATMEGMPQTWWTIDDYMTKRIDDQIEWFGRKAREHTLAMRRGRAISLTLGGAAVLLSAVTAATSQGAALATAVLGVVTTAGGSIGAFFQAGHYEAIALKYRETAEALASLKAEFRTAPTPPSPGELVSTAEAIMQVESTAWLGQLTGKAGLDASAS